MADDIDEFSLIERYLAPLSAGMPGALALRDDAAIIPVTAGRRLVVTTDAVVEGVHFPAGEEPAMIARRLLRVNLSDLAAMGARPVAYTLNLILPPGTDAGWVAGFAAGLAEDQALFEVALIGGDTSRTPGPLTLSVSAYGEVAENHALLRGGARPGEAVYVSGTIGDAALGLAVLQGRLVIGGARERDYLVSRFRLPEPRLAVGQGLVDIASAAADISDGLIADLGHICAVSGVAAVIDLVDIPLSPAARAAVTDNQPLHTSLLTGGDDYELVFTVPDSACARLPGLSERLGIPLTRIGRIVEAGDSKHPVILRDAQGRTVEVSNGGYRHF